jgi:hypothetical protein
LHDNRLKRRAYRTYRELHGLSTRSTELSRNDNLATLGATLHDESQNTIAGSSDGQTIKKFVTEGFTLSDSRQTTVLDLSSIEGDGVFGELESFLDEGGEFANTAALLTENFLGVCGADNC